MPPLAFSFLRHLSLTGTHPPLSLTCSRASNDPITTPLHLISHSQGFSVKPIPRLGLWNLDPSCMDLEHNLGRDWFTVICIIPFRERPFDLCRVMPSSVVSIHPMMIMKLLLMISGTRRMPEVGRWATRAQGGTCRHRAFKFIERTDR